MESCSSEGLQGGGTRSGEFTLKAIFERHILKAAIGISEHHKLYTTLQHSFAEGISERVWKSIGPFDLE